jgi:hypothetical protein
LAWRLRSTDPEVYSRWLQVPVTIDGDRFAATLEFQSLGPSYSSPTPISAATVLPGGANGQAQSGSYAQDGL